MSIVLRSVSYVLLYVIPIHPSPSKRVIMDHTSKLVAAIQKSLKTGTLRDNKVSLEFRSEVYNYIHFKARGGRIGDGS